ncbi:MAG: hypothetical protein GX757_13020 [Clostridiales bacterium]|nr:hypothetical protein [Clostridiales bacterium]
MRSDLITIGVILKELNCFNLDSLSNRIILQKKVFLLQNLGVNLGYQYSWYVHGPYSTELTAMAYECIPLGEEQFTNYNIKENIKERIKKVNDLEKCEARKKVKLDNSAWYELLASYLYWKKQLGTQDKAVEMVQITKPQFSDTDIEAAIQALVDFER